jgi:hypothetical protein
VQGVGACTVDAGKASVRGGEKGRESLRASEEPGKG